LGTGCGSTFIDNGNILKGEKGIPENGMIYNQPFKESVIDDYISVRGLNRITEKYFGKTLSGKELYRIAEGGNTMAIQVFADFGKSMSEALGKYVENINADAVIFGGQISKSFSFFKDGFFGNMKSIDVKVSKDTSIGTMRGLFSILHGS
jgi:glucokinase